MDCDYCEDVCGIYINYGFWSLAGFSNLWISSRQLDFATVRPFCEDPSVLNIQPKVMDLFLLFVFILFRAN